VLLPVLRPRWREARRLLEEYDQTFAAPALEDEETRERLAALGYLGWRLWRPFDLIGRTCSSVAAWLRLQKRR